MFHKSSCTPSKSTSLFLPDFLSGIFHHFSLSPFVKINAPEMPGSIPNTHIPIPHPTLDRCGVHPPFFLFRAPHAYSPLPLATSYYLLFTLFKVYRYTYTPYPK